jgi:hypothetical protein
VPCHGAYFFSHLWQLHSHENSGKAVGPHSSAIVPSSYAPNNALKKRDSSKKCNLPYKYAASHSSKQFSFTSWWLLEKLVQNFFQEEVSLWRLNSFLKNTSPPQYALHFEVKHSSSLPFLAWQHPFKQMCLPWKNHTLLEATAFLSNILLQNMKCVF